MNAFMFGVSIGKANFNEAKGFEKKIFWERVSQPHDRLAN
jgi:hypothetical protein